MCCLWETVTIHIYNMYANCQYFQYVCNLQKTVIGISNEIKTFHLINFNFILKSFGQISLPLVLFPILPVLWL